MRISPPLGGPNSLLDLLHIAEGASVLANPPAVEAVIPNLVSGSTSFDEAEQLLALLNRSPYSTLALGSQSSLSESPFLRLFPYANPGDFLRPNESNSLLIDFVLAPIQEKLKEIGIVRSSREAESNNNLFGHSSAEATRFSGPLAQMIDRVRAGATSTRRQAPPPDARPYENKAPHQSENTRPRPTLFTKLRKLVSRLVAKATTPRRGSRTGSAHNRPTRKS